MSMSGEARCVRGTAKLMEARSYGGYVGNQDRPARDCGEAFDGQLDLDRCGPALAAEPRGE
jgi:hypothetical protein